MSYRPPWNEAREALVLAEYPTDTDTPKLVDRINALAGPRPVTVGGLQEKVRNLRLRKTPETLSQIKRSTALAAWHTGSRQVERVNADGAYRAPIDGPTWNTAIFRHSGMPVPDDLTPQQQAEIADAAVDRKYASARRMIRARKPAAVVAHTTGLKLREVLRLAGEVRMGVGS